MRTLLVLCLIAAACAAPQYNYQQPAGGIGGGPSGAASAPSGSFAPGGSGGLGGSGGSAGPAVWNKQYFIHSAPEDDGLDGASSNDNSASLRKNLRVVFVKSPENKGLENAALQLAKSASEDKTAIYVLNKQTDLAELQNKLSQIQDSNANKPEVHFVKYKTPEEAEHAQHSIQSQYDQSYQGPSQVSNEGVAPVENYVGSAGGSSGGFGAGGQGGFGGGSNGGSSGGNGGFSGGNGGFSGGNGGFSGGNGGFSGGNAGFSGGNGGFQGAQSQQTFATVGNEYLPATARF